MSAPPESTYYRYYRGALESNALSRILMVIIHPYGGSQLVTIIGMKQLGADDVTWYAQGPQKGPQKGIKGLD